MKFLLILSFLLPMLSNARTFDEIKSSGKIIIASEGAFAPFNFFREGELTGFEIDIANAIAKELGLKVEWKTYGFDSLLIGLSQGNYDVVIASHGITEERQKAVNFTNPHYCTGGIIVSREGGPLSAKDLKGKTVAVQVGTTYYNALKNIDGIRAVRTYPRDTDSFQNLMSRRVDAVVTDRFLAREAIETHKKRVKMQTGELLFEERIAMAVSKNNNSLVNKLNSALDKIIKNGTYKKISEKYFGEDIGCK